MPDKTGDFIICPYCDSEHTNMCNYPKDLSRSREEKMNCWECGKTFIVKADAIWTFYTFEKKGESK